MDVESIINLSEPMVKIKKPRKTKKKLLSDFKIISPTSPLKQQIREAIKTDIELLSNQKPKIIIMDESVKKRRTKKAKSPSPIPSPKAKSPSPKATDKPKKRRTKKVKPQVELVIEESPSPIPSPKAKSLTPILSPKVTDKPKKRRTKKLKAEVEIVIEEKTPKQKTKKVRKSKMVPQLATASVHVLEGIAKNEDKMVELEKEEEEKKEIEKEKSLKTPEVKQVEMMQGQEPNKVYNQEFIDILDKLSTIMSKQGEPFKARAYQKAQETIMAYPGDITSPSQLKGMPGIGETIMEKLNEYVQTGTLKVLEREKTNPVNILADVYGIGPKKAKELVDKGITSISQLRENQGELNDVQRVGLQYYEQILERIPRSEIEEYKVVFNSAFERMMLSNSNQDETAKFEIVGSYRRGAANSGDIDVIITGDSVTIYKNFIDELIKQKVITNVLSRGLSKTLVIAKLPGKQVARRVDFLYSPPDEFPFAILYFTGSKAFNTVMRHKALEMGYTLNEHGFSNMDNKVKGSKIEQSFVDERAIFDFLKMAYKTPIERQDGRAVVALGDVGAPKVAAANAAPTPVKAAALMDVGVPKMVATKLPPTPMKAAPLTSVGAPKVVESAAAPTLVKAEEIPPDVKANIEKFAHEGISVLEHLNEKMLVDMIRFASKVYYNSKQIITDNQYDIIKDFTNAKFPSNAAVTEIGADVLRNKAQLPYEMASMDKIKPDTNALKEWSAKYKGPYILSCKLDGVSGLYTTEDAVPKLYTRGNGKVGQDISYLIPHLKLPKTKGIAIRGEFVIPKATFETKYKTKFANPRNMVAGIINHKTLNETIKDIHFVAYEAIMPANLSPSKQMDFLGTIDVERVLYKTETALSNELLSKLLVDWRTNYAYEIDGVIVTNDAVYPRESGNPDHAFAFKMVLSDQMAEAKVVDVIWTPSKDGLLKPRVRIEPIHLGGVQIEYATGFNGAFIKDNNIGIGATIELIRSGDVIPHIKSVIVPAPEPKMPSIPYKWNDTHVDIMLENAAEDPIVKEKNITGFFKGIEVDGLGAGNVAKIIAAGYDSVGKIIRMSEADFLKVEGFQKKMATKIFTGIRDKLTNASIVTIMSASNVFGHGFSEARLTLIMDAEPKILTSVEPNEVKIQKIKEIKGMAAKTASAFVEKIPDFVEFMKDIGLESKLQTSKTLKAVVPIVSHPLNGKTIVVTGLTEKVIEDKVKSVGAKFGSAVSKNTNIVVAKSVDESSGKLDKARELNKTLAIPIQIISLDDFLKMF
jgi:NAD-dependent DNA ligase